LTAPPALRVAVAASPQYLAFFLWKEVSPEATEDSRLFVEKPRTRRGLI
jgi:hypothetical protein